MVGKVIAAAVGAAAAAPRAEMGADTCSIELLADTKQRQHPTVRAIRATAAADPDVPVSPVYAATNHENCIARRHGIILGDLSIS